MLRPLLRSGSLNNDLARRIADRNGGRLTRSEVDNRKIIGSLISHVSLFAIAGGGCPMRLFTNGDAARWIVRGRIEQKQFAGSLHDNHPESGAPRVTHVVRRYSGRNLSDDFA